MLPDDYDLPPYDGPTVEFLIRHDPAQEDAALLLARRLFAELDMRIAALSLVPESGADFELWLDGEKIHSTVDAGREPSAQRAVALAWDRLRAAEQDISSTDENGRSQP